MSRFSEYLTRTFDFSPAQAEEIILAMKKPIGKSIRVNTQKIALADFRKHAQKQGWTLTETDIPEVFLIDREDTAVALGNTMEHCAGWFYIQEVAAAHPPYLLKREIMKNDNLDSTSRSQAHLAGMTGTILDMCAAPGGKTTQLADYFPDSLIIANEVNRTRTPQLFDNLDRMGYDNIAAVSCDGRFFQNFPDFFDAVLLDAPCSGEGTAFRDASVIDHWNEKNIDRIAKLQRQLFETAEAVTAPGGMLSYSTCTLNKEENEGVITFNAKRSTLNEIYLKRFWPHIERTGGFFASIFQKKPSDQIRHEYPVLAAKGQKNTIVRAATKGEREIVDRFVAKHLGTELTQGYLYLTKEGVYLNRRNLGPLAQHFFFVHAGARIGTIRGNAFTPSNHLWWHLVKTDHIPELSMTPEIWHAILTRKYADIGIEDGHYALRWGEGILGLWQVEDGKGVKTLFGV